MTEEGLVLVHGLFAYRDAGRREVERAGARRADAMAAHGDELGVRGHEWVDGRARAIASRMLRRARGTARPVDAVEIVELDEPAVRASLDDAATSAGWRSMACGRDGFDPARSFVLIGRPLLLLDGPPAGQRVLWLGRGLPHLDDAEFVAHYTRCHGPLVAGHAGRLGLRRYRQVPREEPVLAGRLAELGLGRAEAPPVFAELFTGRPPLGPGGLKAGRVARREIRIDEARHIDFARSMLLLV